MTFTPTSLAGSYTIDLAPHIDDRGWFARFYSKDLFAQIGHQKEWVQLNHSYTREKGALRGMHFQLPPFGEIKMVRCIAEGFAHGFQVLQEDSELIYHHTEFYTPEAESGIRYNDPRVNIQWPLPVTTLSERDAAFDFLTDHFKGI